MSEVEFTLGTDAPPAAAGAAVQAIANDLGLSAERSTQLRALVEQLVLEARDREAVDGSSDVVVRTAQGPGRLRVHVADRRLPLLARESRRSPSRRMAALGFADRLRLRNDGDDGNVATCEIEIASGPDEHASASAAALAEVGLGHDPAPGSVPARASEGDAAALVVRPMQSDDAPALARCVYRSYGYSYLDPVLYRPRPLRRALHSGLLRSFVAVAPDGEVVGHCAFTFEHAGDPVPEAGKLVVDPRFRGHHIAERLAAERRRWAVEAELVGFWSECVTNHPFSQREVIGTGGAETGLLIGAVPASLTMQGLENHGGRHTLLPMYVSIADRGPQVLHVPARHAATLDAMATAAGLERTVVAADLDDGLAHGRSPRSSLGLDVAVNAGTAHLRVHRVGADLLDRVGDELEALQEFDLGAVHLDLPLGDPATGPAVTRLERSGFCWGAWVPCFGPDGNDVLRLQRTGSHPLDVTEIACARPEGELVRDRVVAEWRRVLRGE